MRASLIFETLPLDATRLRLLSRRAGEGAAFWRDEATTGAREGRCVKNQPARVVGSGPLFRIVIYNEFGERNVRVADLLRSRKMRALGRQ